MNTVAGHGTFAKQGGTMSLKSKIDRIFARWKGKNSPGMAVAVAIGAGRRRVIHRYAYGMADLDYGIPNTTKTVFHCASLAKQFTAMSIVLLSQRKKPNGRPVLGLDDDVGDHLWQLRHFPKITIRQLLHHTSGIRDMLIQLTLAGWRWGDDAMTRDDVLHLVSRMNTLNFSPGSAFAYSNTNYFLAGEIVRNVSGQSLAEFAQENIFTPLDMTSTRFVETYCETVKNRAYGYRSSNRVSAAPFEKRIPNYDLTGPTNLFTTVEDLILWAENFGQRQKGEFARAVAELQRPGENSDGYGLGLFVARDRNNKPRIVEHNGRTIGYRAHLFRDNEHGISVALLCNVEFADVLATDKLVFAVSQIVRGGDPRAPNFDHAEIEVPTGTKPAEALKEYCGTYYSSEIDTAYEVVGNGFSLEIRRPRYPDCALTDFPGYSDDTFVARGLTEVLREVEVTFLRGGDGSITGLQLDWSRRLGGSRLAGFRFARR
jgi:CubicO group peptidase (beta-lactamase class C family)